MKEKVKVQMCTEKKRGTSAAGKPYVIYEVTLEDGRVGDCFDECQAGEECEMEITPNSNTMYNDNFKKTKPVGAANGGGKFPAKDWTSEKRIASLKCATDLIVGGKVPLEQLKATREEFFQYLNTK